jgi:FkbM family methyltransferase
MLSIHHIGSRGETQAFPHFPAFDADVVNVLVDADAASVEETRQHNAGRRGCVIVVPACIAGANGRRTFRHAASAYASSLLPPDPSLGDAYVSAHWIDHDYVLREALATSRAEAVDAVTLDTFVETSNGSIPPPDLLSLDTQGSELEILSGSPHSLAAAVAVVTEVEFISLYDGQPLFGDIATFLQGSGFLFCGFGNVLLDGSYHRAPVGLRGRQIPVTTDAVFLRRPETVTIDADRRLRALAFFSLVNGYLEHAQWALSRLPLNGSPQPDVPTWWRFVDEFRHCAARFPPLLPDAFISESATGPRTFPAHLRAARTAIESSLDEMATIWNRYGLGEIGALQRQRYQDMLRQYGVE